MKKKLANKRGFTIAEVLVATAILAIFVSMAIVGTSALFGTSEQMMTVSKAAVLGSDVMKVITNEIRFGENFVFTGEGTKTLTSYNSTTYGENCLITMDGDGQLIIRQTSKGYNTDGTLAEDITTDFLPIGSAAYDEVCVSSVTFTASDLKVSSSSSKVQQVVTCTLSIVSSADRHTLWEKSVSIVPLFQKATVS